MVIRDEPLSKQTWTSKQIYVKFFAIVLRNNNLKTNNIMEKVVQFLTQNQVNAFEVVKKLKSLDDTSEISLGEYYIFNKDENGKVSLQSEQSDGAIENTLFGALTGGVFGALFGPAGLLLGSSFGALTGGTVDLVSEINKEDYLQKITKDLPNNSVVVVAQIVEDWTTPIDSSIGDLAQIKRADIDDEVENLIGAQIDDLEKEIEDAEEDMKNAVGEAKETYREKVEKLKANRDEHLEKLHESLEAQKQSYHNWTQKMKAKGVEVEDNIQNRVDNLNNQIEETENKIKNAVGNAKAQYQEKVDELKAKRDAHIKHIHETVDGEKEKYHNWVTRMKNKMKGSKFTGKGTIKVSILYLNTEGKHFDMGYYANNHIPNVGKMLGKLLIKATVEKGLSGVQQNSKTPYITIASMYFASLGDFRKAFEPHAITIMKDVANFTDIEPVIQVSEVLL